MFDSEVEIPMQAIPLLNRDGVQIATLHDATIEEVARVIRKKRAEGWAFLRTMRFGGRVLVQFKRK